AVSRSKCTVALASSVSFARNPAPNTRPGLPKPAKPCAAELDLLAESWNPSLAPTETQFSNGKDVTAVRLSVAPSPFGQHTAGSVCVLWLEIPHSKTGPSLNHGPPSRVTSAMASIQECKIGSGEALTLDSSSESAREIE